MAEGLFAGRLDLCRPCRDGSVADVAPQFPVPATLRDLFSIRVHELRPLAECCRRLQRRVPHGGLPGACAGSPGAAPRFRSVCDVRDALRAGSRRRLLLFECLPPERIGDGAGRPHLRSEEPERCRWSGSGSEAVSATRGVNGRLDETRNRNARNACWEARGETGRDGVDVSRLPSEARLLHARAEPRHHICRAGGSGRAGPRRCSAPR